MPAVARDGGPPAQTSTPWPGVATSVSDPLEETGATERLGHLPNGGETVRIDPLGLDAEQARELAGMRRQHRGRRPLRKGSSSNSASASTTSRQVCLLEQPPHELAPALVPPEAGAYRERARLLTASKTSSRGRFTTSRSLPSSTGSDSAGAATAT